MATIVTSHAYAGFALFTLVQLSTAHCICWKRHSIRRRGRDIGSVHWKWYLSDVAPPSVPRSGSRSLVQCTVVTTSSQQEDCRHLHIAQCLVNQLGAVKHMFAEHNGDPSIASQWVMALGICGRSVAVEHAVYTMYSYSVRRVPIVWMQARRVVFSGATGCTCKA